MVGQNGLYIVELKVYGGKNLVDNALVLGGWADLLGSRPYAGPTKGNPRFYEKELAVLALRKGEVPSFCWVFSKKKSEKVNRP